MGLAVAVSLGDAEVILLDGRSCLPPSDGRRVGILSRRCLAEPTSALDPETTERVEKTLLGLLPNGDAVRTGTRTHRCLPHLTTAPRIARWNSKGAGMDHSLG